MTADSSTTPQVDSLVEKTSNALDGGRYPIKVINNEAVYQEELRRIFARAWVYLGHSSEFTQPGDYARRYIGEDPFIVARDENGEMHAFLDSCMHRGAQFCTAEQGNTSHFRCPYHGWTYKNDGSLQGMPHMGESYQDLDKGEIELQEANLEMYHGLIFGRIANEGPTLEEYLGDFTWYLDMLFNLTEGGLAVIGDPHRWEAEYDWKTAADNFSGDSYHVLTTHQASLETENLELGPWEELDDYLKAAYLSCADSHAGAYYLSKESETYMGYPDEIVDYINDDLTPKQKELFGRSVFHFGTVFPNMSYIHGIQSGGWGGPWVCLRKWQPRGCGKTETISWWLVPEEFADDEEFLEDSHRGWGSLSPGGSFESDDLTIWEGISESSAAMTHELRDNVGNMQQGMEGMSDKIETMDDPVYGPGETIWQGSYFDEINSRKFYRAWCEMMEGVENPGAE